MLVFRIGFVIAMLSLSPLICISSAEPELEWVRTFGGYGEDVGTSVCAAKDGGFVIIGSTESFGAGIGYSWLIKSSRLGNIWLIKTDSEGNVQWDKTFGGLGKDIGFSVQETKDLGFILGGATKSQWVGNYDLWLIKIDKNGTMVWDKKLGGSNDEWANFVQETNDGGFIVVGGTESYGVGTDETILGKSTLTENLWLIKTDFEGNVEWEKTFGGPDIDEGSSVRETIDGGYIIVGYTTSYGSGANDLWLIKTDSEGNYDWMKTFGGSNDDVGFSALETIDGGYIVTGYTASYGRGNNDLWLIKTDSKGNEEWSKTFGGPGFDEGTSIAKTNDGGYIITGYTMNQSETNGFSWLINPPDPGCVWLVKTDSMGNEEWNKTISGSGNDWGNFVIETEDGAFVVTGGTESFDAEANDVLLAKLKLV